jgi:hypothetical protein
MCVKGNNHFKMQICCNIHFSAKFAEANQRKEKPENFDRNPLYSYDPSTGHPVQSIIVLTVE